MNLYHLRTFCWLRWRLFANQLAKRGIATVVVLSICGVFGGVAVLGLFLSLVFLGALLPVELPPAVLLLIWDGLVVAFLFSWSIGLLAELQRSEALSPEKFLHLPVSLSGVFFLNYLSSLFSLTLLMFVPLMAGLALGLVISRGPALLMVMPLMASFFLMVTGLTYQFQGWLASLMVNKRRRRTIIVVVTLVFVIVCQLPNLANFYFNPAFTGRLDELGKKMKQDQAELDGALAQKKITVAEYQQKLQELQRHQVKQSVKEGEEIWQMVQEWAWFANAVAPPGWLPLGASTAADGNVLPALLATLGMGLIGTASLWRAYRTTLRLYTGQFTAGNKAPAPAASAVAALPAEKPSVALLEKSIRGLSEQAAAIALATFRSILRAPEAKMLLLSPIIMVVLFGGLFMRSATDLPVSFRPLFSFGAMAMILFSLMQLVGNQFGFDRGGFRVFVLSPVPRRDMLLGKNLALLPIAFALAAPMVVLLEFLRPLRLDHLLAMPVQFVSMFLFFCLLANWMSILVPMPIAAGSLKPVNPKVIPVLLSLLFIFVMPVVQAPTLLPLGVEAALVALGWGEGVPINLILSLLECAAIVIVYRVVLNWQGALLQRREKQILETVTTKAE